MTERRFAQPGRLVGHRLDDVILLSQKRAVRWSTPKSDIATALYAGDAEWLLRVYADFGGDVAQALVGDVFADGELLSSERLGSPTPGPDVLVVTSSQDDAAWSSGTDAQGRVVAVVLGSSGPNPGWGWYGTSWSVSNWLYEACMPAPQSMTNVVDVLRINGVNAGATPDLIIEIPHGATRTADFDAVKNALTSPLPEGLSDFFHVNTDAGAPELAVALAHRFVKLDPTKSVAILRCRIPRTFIDCNRRIDANPAEFKEGKVTPGLMPWVTTEADRELLLSRYRAYVKAVDDAVAEVMPKGGAMLLLHTYAPRSVGVEVDLDIVKSLRAAYTPEQEPTWPLRPEVDVIHKTLEGVSLAPVKVVSTLKAALGSIAVPLADGESYPMHPSTLAHGHVTKWPGRVLCVEVRRDLLAAPWTPFAEMRISDAECAKLAGPFAEAVREWWR